MLQNKGVRLRKARESDRIPLKEYHLPNIRSEMCNFAGELEFEEALEPKDFPHLNDADRFKDAYVFIVLNS